MVIRRWVSVDLECHLCNYTLEKKAGAAIINWRLVRQLFEMFYMVIICFSFAKCKRKSCVDIQNVNASFKLELCHEAD